MHPWQVLTVSVLYYAYAIYSLHVYVTVHAKRYHKSAKKNSADFVVLFPFLPSYKIWVQGTYNGIDYYVYPRIPGNEERQPVVHSIRSRDRARARDRDMDRLGLGLGLGSGLPLLFFHFRVCVSGNA